MTKKSIVSSLLSILLSISIPFSVIANANAKTIFPAKSYNPIPITNTMGYCIKPKGNTSTRNKLVNFAKKYKGKNINYFTEPKRQKHNHLMKECFIKNEWCDMFMSYVSKKIIPKNPIAKCSGKATWFNCNYWLNAIPNKYKKIVYDKKLCKRYIPQKGDLVFFEKHKEVKGVDHVGMVVSVNKKKHTIKTIEGNIGNNSYLKSKVLYRTYHMTHNWIYAYVKTA